MDEKQRFWLGAALKTLAWAYLVLTVSAVGIAGYGRFLARVPGVGPGFSDVLLFLLSLGVAVGGFFLLRALAKRLNPAG